MRQPVTHRDVMVGEGYMNEIAREQEAPPRAGVVTRMVDVRDDRQSADARRAEVRSMLVRLLVKLYTQRHQEQLKDAA